MRVRFIFSISSAGSLCTKTSCTHTNCTCRKKCTVSSEAVRTDPRPSLPHTVHTHTRWTGWEPLCCLCSTLLVLPWICHWQQFSFTRSKRSEQSSFTETPYRRTHIYHFHLSTAALFIVLHDACLPVSWGVCMAKTVTNHQWQQHLNDRYHTITACF